MKYIVTLLICIVLSSNCYAQQVLIGVKGGVNIGYGGEITGKTSTSGYTSSTYTSTPKQGFHGGIYGQYSVDKWFLRVEGLYNTVTTEFPFDRRPAAYNIDKLNFPLLVGYHIFKPIDIYAGPAYNTILGDATLEDMETNNAVVDLDADFLSLNIGAKAHFGRFEFDIRYEYNFSSNEAYEIDLIQSKYGINLADFNNRRINQLLVSVSIVLFDSSYQRQKSRSRGCYFGG